MARARASHAGVTVTTDVCSVLSPSSSATAGMASGASSATAVSQSLEAADHFRSEANTSAANTARCACSSARSALACAPARLSSVNPRSAASWSTHPMPSAHSDMRTAGSTGPPLPLDAPLPSAPPAPAPASASASSAPVLAADERRAPSRGSGASASAASRADSAVINWPACRARSPCSSSSERSTWWRSLSSITCSSSHAASSACAAVAVAARDARAAASATALCAFSSVLISLEYTAPRLATSSTGACSSSTLASSASASASFTLASPTGSTRPRWCTLSMVDACSWRAADRTASSLDCSWSMPSPMAVILSFARSAAVAPEEPPWRAKLYLQ
mmetsp:Transcript_5969/g.19000  ORF Transcript_5969/g.19000 Transcript_5969/m.19000 type:complete len:336 (-) Transcript_5969:647-1654(-)